MVAERQMENWHPALSTSPASSAPHAMSTFMVLSSVCTSVKWAVGPDQFRAPLGPEM